MEVQQCQKAQCQKAPSIQEAAVSYCEAPQDRLDGWREDWRDDWLLETRPFTSQSTAHFTLAAYPNAAHPNAAHPNAASTAASDVQVWTNTDTGVYHFAGQRWCGETRSGLYMSGVHARKSGHRATKNGQ